MMKLELKDISAVVVTRGDVDLKPVLDTLLPFLDIVVWDNSQRPVDLGVFGRYMGALEAQHEVCFHIDDDVLFTRHQALLDAWEPELLVSNMDPGWVEKGHYEDLAFCGGAGAICATSVLWKAINRWLKVYPLDRMFLLEADFVTGILCPNKKVDLGYQLRTEITERPNRLCKPPWQTPLKEWFMQAAREIRDAE